MPLKNYKVQLAEKVLIQHLLLIAHQPPPSVVIAYYIIANAAVGGEKTLEVTSLLHYVWHLSIADFPGSRLHASKALGAVPTVFASSQPESSPLPTLNCLHCWPIVKTNAGRFNCLSAPT